MKKLILENIEETLKECNIKDEGLTKALAEMNLEDGLGFDRGYQNLAIDGETLDRLEYIRAADDGPVKAKEDKWLEGEDESSDDDDEFTWIEPLV